ncbi:MAG: hypothetical protein ACI376_09590 [Candidatus Bruticola sp.]
MHITENEPLLFTAPDGKSNLQFLDKLCRGGIIQRFNKSRLDKVYAERLNLEMEFWRMNDNALVSLLSVWSCLDWARKQKITINFVSGQLMSSLTAYLLEITQFDPVSWKWCFREVELQGMAAAEVLIAVTVPGDSLLEQYLHRVWQFQPRPKVAAINDNFCFHHINGDISVGVTLSEIIKLLNNCICI